MAKTDAQRRKECDDRQRALGRRGPKVWATDKEHEAIKALLIDMREGYEK